MTMTTIRIACATRTVEVLAIVHGNWAAHGRIGDDYEPHFDVWSVTYAPSGLAVPASYTGKLTETDAIAIAEQLHAAIPELPDVSVETGRRIADAIAAARGAP